MEGKMTEKFLIEGVLDLDLARTHRLFPQPLQIIAGRHRQYGLDTRN